MHLAKHHGLGNDFLIALDETNPVPIEAGPELARALCDRRRGVGADGFIHGARVGGPEADVVMHLWNADGSRAETSGNGIRCLAQAVARARGLASLDVIADTDAGRRHLHVAPGPSPARSSVRVDMGEVRPGPDLPEVLPLVTEAVTTADIGNPHVVAWVADVEALDLAAVGPAVEGQFPAGINLEIIAPVGPDAIVLRVWERGAGITEACGSGACVAAHHAHQWGLVGDRVRVGMPGGEVVVDLYDGRAVLTGEAVHVADLEIDPGEVLGG
ncbi:MAG TPA: diaminopimelate epimerase [Acidimicrobiales bacterium]|nr:diaminopimelate epimerase [Acidimicrobiales bacterium]